MTSQSFSMNLRRLMLRRGITQAEIARRMGVNRSCIHNWYWGIREPNIDSLKRLRRILGCTFDELIGG